MSGGIIPSQTNTNKNNYLFALAGAGGGGVQTITAGSNVSVSGTSNVTINAIGTVATITAGSNVSVSGTSNITINAIGTVASIIAGSNITVSGTSNVTIDATGGGGGPSSSNISHFGAKVIPITALTTPNTFVQLFTIAPTYFSDANSSYLLKCDWGVDSATCSNVSGSVSLVVTYGLTPLANSSIVLQNQSSWTNSSNLNYTENLATTFIPNQGTDELIFYWNNHTTGSITTGSSEFTISITGLTTSNINANNWP
jgi:hypothetical protein